MSLFIVGAPIGNLKDISLRALETLKEADLILTENPRQSLKIFSHFNLPRKRIIRYRRPTEELMDIIYKQKAALLVNSGTPAISDPGKDLALECHKRGIEIRVIPGPSALASIISVCGIIEKEFHFLGFLPKKKGDKLKIFNEYFQKEETIVFYESPYRLVKTLEILKENFPQSRVFIAKEMTKIFENYFLDSPEELLKKFADDKKLLRGEFSLVAKLKP